MREGSCRVIGRIDMIELGRTNGERAMTEFKRPAGTLDDPEHAYRSGYQDGVQACLEALQGRIKIADDLKLRRWLETELQTWRHDRKAIPTRLAPS